MSFTIVGGKNINVDIRGELENFEWLNANWSDEKLIASSPFRSDNSPSFAMTLEGDHAGTWKDSGAEGEEWGTGNLVTLLAFLRNESFKESEEYLLSLYDTEYKYDDMVLVLPTLKMDTEKYVPEYVLQSHPVIFSDYIANRGIGLDVQELYGIRTNEDYSEVAFPWRSVNSYLVTVKYRKTNDKRFFYLKGGNPVKNNIFGIDLVYKFGTETAVIGEAEVDAMSWTEAKNKKEDGTIRSDRFKIIGLAVGGVTLSDKQAELIIKSPIKNLVIAADNDKAGQRLRRSIEAKLKGKVNLFFVEIPGPHKDANDVLTKEGPESLNNLRPYRINSLNIQL